MRHTLFAVCLSLLLTCSVLAADVPDPSYVVRIYPEAIKAGPPEVIKPGTRLIYLGASATIAGSYNQLVPDANGRWVNKTTGQRFGAQNVATASGAGYNVVRVAYVDRDVAVTTNMNYMIDAVNNVILPGSAGGMVSHAGCAGDYWLHPKVLAAIKEVTQGGTVIVRMPYVVNDRKYNAIRFQTSTDVGHTAYVYDLDSGLMIFYGASTVGAGVVAPGPNGQAVVGGGSTMLVTSHLMEVKEIDLPWKNAPMPRWAGEFKELRYEGVHSTVIPNASTMNRGMALSVTPKARGNGWVRTVGDSVTTTPGFPATRDRNENATGNASVGGLWIPPEGMAGLKVGQVIETNEITKTKLVVGDIGRGHVTLTEIGGAHRTDITYDSASGILASIVMRQQSGIATISVGLKLTGQR
jgi:hypothetical protein